ncbi:uncharacterized protein F5891DRAFT_585994 [Suillus fuscotomentosus]|uniref:Uncharacterized protein n=1 Tax=Suillus fuscotomentosus TaxID=1912939 RepID=A0AAD4DZ31_9AGAM|nr:uncharacterized protein F5891DRAFT_585994 [Suillus fuscotomentosus]KAG1896540.1 hypothetical protein F5891DRAFT_585994 [Suillus fuscotomentosus]
MLIKSLPIVRRMIDLFVSVSILNTHADQVVAHSLQRREVSVSTLIRATAMLTLQVVAHRSQEEGAGASEVSDTLGFTRIDP